ncbi:uncharacterized protein SPAPADRAFT_130700 [Spathaspora passalidarum NRRL Y-27907]|uniref:BZIP domain-containing protein n=1 Tax=Spathaspora passalidarum (strain NRRL Y-27907 / 11-Y1) TaxID=619300 RepID=G3AGP3_SPAPN|nr:uncharacterized protein SPAPADRAFT_130700 [Spathaspora passalidarum NRRL Y-27907]EGW34620.1 hypothetical protein SPAPADRAFT_130700 [Spathaspora passalidarum NRRL Y-27907]
MSKNPDFLSFLHNPFDINSYPITNPPIFDSTMLLPITPDGIPRRRRISISNGQIGQIVNHEAYFEAIAVAPPQQSMQNQMQVIPPPAQVPAQQEQSKTQFAGVPPPNHQLIYNNEVIFNPNNGPIPGTAAWKKERLLERNRIAASKCRQRKKQAQMELQNNIDKLEAELKDRDLKIQKLQATLKIYNKVLLSHFENGDDISELKQVIEQSQSLLN